MEQDTGITAIAYVIQLSVAPVFLLSGIGAMLAVMTNRLGRIVDYDRVIKERIVQTGDQPSSTVMSELGALSRRSRLIGHSITLCTLTALLVCAVIGMLFLNAVLQFDTSTTVAILFIAAMLAFFSRPADISPGNFPGDGYRPGRAGASAHSATIFATNPDQDFHAGGCT
jgi:hypothetical protein